MLTSRKKLLLTMVTSIAIGVPLSYIGVAAWFWKNELGETVSKIFLPAMAIKRMPSFIPCNDGFLCFVLIQMFFYGLLGFIVFVTFQLLRRLDSLGSGQRPPDEAPIPRPPMTWRRWRKLLTAMTIVVIVSAVLAAGAEVRKKMNDHYFKGNDRMLESAISADDSPAIEKALAQGANVNARGIHGVTPLMLAVDGLKKSAVLELLARGGNPNEKADDGNSAVSLAVENYHHSPEIFFAIMKAGGDPNIRRPDNDPVIIRFINDCDCEYIRHMKSFGADLDIHTREDDPLIIDAGLGADWDVVWCLIELGAKYDYDETTSRAPLTLSIAGEFPSPDSPIYPYKKKVWHFLHDHGTQLKPLK